MQSVPITTDVVSLILAHGEVYWIQQSVIKFVSDLLTTTIQLKIIDILLKMTGLWFSPGTPVSSTNKTDRHEITEILLKVEFTELSFALTKDVSYLVVLS